MKDKNDIEMNFHWWITCIPDRIEDLKNRLPDTIYRQLDCSIDSVLSLSSFILQTETEESIRSDRELWDSCAAYIGAVYEKNVPTAKWRVESEDKDSVYYGTAMLVTDNQLIFAPHFEITTMLNRKKSEFICNLISKHAVKSTTAR